MNNLKQLSLLIIIAIQSCSTPGMLLPIANSSHKRVIEKLPSAQKISRQEMQAWYSANVHLDVITPLWDKSLETIYKGCHVVQVPVGDNAALIFTKSNGVLSVEAYRWVKMNPWSQFDTGNIMVYSFQNNRIAGFIYRQGIITKSAGIDVLVDVPQDALFSYLILADIPGLQ